MNNTITNHLVNILLNQLKNVTNNNLKAEFDWRYSQTLRINFNSGIGIGSYGEYSEIKSLVEEEGFQYKEEDLKYADQFNEICDCINKTFQNLCTVDWRDENELELHFDFDEETCAVFVTKQNEGGESWFAAPVKLVTVKGTEQLHHEDNTWTERYSKDLSHFEAENYAFDCCNKQY